MIQDLFDHKYNLEYKNIKPTDDSIVLCYKKGYVYLNNDSLKISNEYNVIQKNNTWDRKLSKYIDINVSPIELPKDFDDQYFINLVIGATEKSCFTSGNIMGDVSVNMRSSRDIYEDAMWLFEYYQGCPYLNKVLEFTIRELKKKKIIIRTSIKDYGHTIRTIYVFRKPKH